jgi:hypothetical protein
MKIMYETTAQATCHIFRCITNLSPDTNADGPDYNLRHFHGPDSHTKAIGAQRKKCNFRRVIADFLVLTASRQAFAEPHCYTSAIVLFPTDSAGRQWNIECLDTPDMLASPLDSLTGP